MKLFIKKSRTRRIVFANFGICFFLCQIPNPAKKINPRSKSYLLNFSEVKQIVTSSQFWSTRWVRFANSIKRLPRGQSSPPGQTNGNSWVICCRFGPVVRRSGSMHRAVLDTADPCDRLRSKALSSVFAPVKGRCTRMTTLFFQSHFLPRAKKV